MGWHTAQSLASCHRVRTSEDEAGKNSGKVVGLAVGGCAELSSTVHRLVLHLATQAGEREAKDTGEEVEECILAQKQRIGRRIARQV